MEGPLTDLFHALLDGVVYALARNHRRSSETGPSPDGVVAAAAVVVVAIEAIAWSDSGVVLLRVEQQDGEHVL